MLQGDRVQLCPIHPEDVERLRAIRLSPSVHRWWGSPEDPAWPWDEPDTEVRAIWTEGQLVGFVQWYDNREERYRHAGIDLFVDGPAQGIGLGRETVSLVVEHLQEIGHHRITIDPAADNAAAIACYSACGFRPVGTMRKYERDNDGQGWHDGLLMEFVAEV